MIFRPGLTRHDKLNLSDSAIMWEETNNASCVINSDYKILWVVNSENYIYKRNALNKAKQVRERERDCCDTVSLDTNCFLIADSPHGLHQEVEAVELLAPGLGRLSRQRGPAEQTQRLDAGPGGGTQG